MKRPESKKQTRQVLGFFSFFRDYIPNFSAIAKPLTDLTGKRVPEPWPLSTALCHWCNISIRAWVVDRFLRAPYWRSSSWLPTRSTIQDPTKEFQQFSKHCSDGDRPKTSLDRSRRMDFRYLNYVRFLPIGRDKSFAQRCTKDGANWTSELKREITQYPISESIRPWRFVNVDLVQLMLDVIWTDREVTGQYIWWQW